VMSTAVDEQVQVQLPFHDPALATDHRSTHVILHWQQSLE